MPTWEGGGSEAGNTAPPATRTTLIVTDNTHRITNVGTLVFTSGATVSDGGNGLASVTISAGGKYSPGLGIGFDTITNPGTTAIYNTGTLIQPADSGGGIYLQAASATGTANASGAYIFGGNAVDGNALGGGFVAGHATGAGNGGDAVLRGGYSTNAPGRAGYAGVYGGVAKGDGQTAGPVQIFGGDAQGSAGIAGAVTIKGGDGTGTNATGANVMLIPGTGATNGVVLVSSMPTADPSIAGAFYVDPVTHIVKWK